MVASIYSASFAYYSGVPSTQSVFALFAKARSVPCYTTLNQTKTSNDIILRWLKIPLLLQEISQSQLRVIGAIKCKTIISNTKTTNYNHNENQAHITEGTIVEPHDHDKLTGIGEHLHHQAQLQIQDTCFCII